jgi:hypothetical protein
MWCSEATSAGLPRSTWRQPTAIRTAGDIRRLEAEEIIGRGPLPGAETSAIRKESDSPTRGIWFR